MKKINPPPGHHIHTFIHDKVAISKVRIHYTKILVYQVGLSILIQVGLRGADNIAVPIEKSAMRPEAVMARADYLRDGPSFPIEQKRPDRAVFASVSARFLGQVSLLNEGKVQGRLLLVQIGLQELATFSKQDLTKNVVAMGGPGGGLGSRGGDGRALSGG